MGQTPPSVPSWQRWRGNKLLDHRNWVKRLVTSALQAAAGIKRTQRALYGFNASMANTTSASLRIEFLTPCVMAAELVMPSRRRRIITPSVVASV